MIINQETRTEPLDFANGSIHKKFQREACSQSVNGQREFTALVPNLGEIIQAAERDLKTRRRRPLHDHS